VSEAESDAELGLKLYDLSDLNWVKRLEDLSASRQEFLLGNW
jgi:hypothetical protein